MTYNDGKVTIEYDKDDPNTVKNRLIRLLREWNLIKKLYKINTDEDMLNFIYYRMFKDITETKPKCSDALNCTYNQTNPCLKEVRDKFSNCPFR